jgi:hypothetical protein
VNPFREYEIDAQKERDGVPFVIKSEDGADQMTFYLRYAGSGNRRFQYAIGKRREQHKARPKHNGAEVYVEPGELELIAQNDAAQEVFAESIVVNWEGVEGRDGQPLACTPENVLDVLRSCPGIWDQIVVAAADRKRYGPDPAQDGAALGKH